MRFEKAKGGSLVVEKRDSRCRRTCVYWEFWVCVNERKGHENSSKHKQHSHTHNFLLHRLNRSQCLTHGSAGFWGSVVRSLYFQMQAQYSSWIKWSQGYSQAPTSCPGSVLFWGSLPAVQMSGSLLEWSREYLGYEVTSCFGSEFTSVTDRKANPFCS